MTAREKKVTQQTSPGGMLTGWARQGVQSFVAAQKILLDLAAQENALLIGMVRERLNKPGIRPGASLTGIAESGVKNVATAGKILLDFAAGETALAVEATKESLRLPPAVGVMADVVRHRVDTFVELQKHLLDATVEQANLLAESYREGEPIPAAARVAELTRRGIEGFVASEKKFLDLAAHEVSTATKDGKHAHKPVRDRMHVLTEAAREGAEKYIDTQKKLLELAIDQLEAAGKKRPEHKEVARKAGQQSLGELTEKSVKNIVTAEKSLLELAIKRVHEAGPKEGKKAAKPGRTARRGGKRHPAVAGVAAD